MLNFFYWERIDIIIDQVYHNQSNSFIRFTIVFDLWIRWKSVHQNIFFAYQLRTTKFISSNGKKWRSFLVSYDWMKTFFDKIYTTMYKTWIIFFRFIMNINEFSWTFWSYQYKKKRILYLVIYKSSSLFTKQTLYFIINNFMRRTYDKKTNCWHAIERK